MKTIGLISMLGLVAVLGCGSGDDEGAAAFEGCGDDNDCKGDRVCEDGMCVDPNGSGDGDSNSDGNSGDGDNGGDGDSGDGDSGDGDSGDGDSGDGDVVDDPELEAACMRDCEARHDADCETNIGSLDQCRGQCLIVDEINQGYCLDERRAQYNCLAAGGYTCVNGYPQPKSTCIEENLALSLCNQEYPCHRFCDAVDGMECAPEGDCFESCRATETGFEDAICNYDYSRLVSCWGNGLTCNGSRPAIDGCQREVADVADCVARRETQCDGFCLGAELAGCGSADCVETCTSKLEDGNCGSYYRRFIECTYDRSYNGFFLECVDGDPRPTAECDSERTEYDNCVSPASG